MTQDTELVCKRCMGRGYHHGFGENGHNPDWCSECGGQGIEHPRLDQACRDNPDLSREFVNDLLWAAEEVK